MKAILMSIQPKWCELIASGKKTVEVRKTAPKDTPFKCYIYATKPKKWFRFSSWGYASDESLWLSNGKVKMCDGFEFWADGKEYEPLCGKVIGEFVCDEVYGFRFSHYEAEYDITHEQMEKMFLNQPELIACGKGKPLYGLHISELKIYDKPRELGEFRNSKNLLIKKPFQSWGYCYENDN